MEYSRLLARAVDAKGDYFPGHSDGVAYLLRLMASVAEMDKDEADCLELIGMLHDVGKIHTPDAILRKPSTLTAVEFDAIRLHPIQGEEIVRSIQGMEHLAPAVRHHHEHWDGSGYPDGLAGKAIPYHSRLLLVADAFHVMTSRRPYQQPRSRAAAVREVALNAGKQFCPIAASLLVDRADSVAGVRPDRGLAARVREMRDQVEG